MTITCIVCNLESSKYKCPECKISYCSLKCWKEHKQTNCKPSPHSKETEEQKNDSDDVYFSSVDTVSKDRLEQLEHSEELKKMLRSTDLQNILLAVDTSNKPEEAIKTAMSDPLFVKFVDVCLSVVEPSTDFIAPQEKDDVL